METDAVAEYLMEDEAWVADAVPDHAVVSHGGHGMDSYALTVRLALGPVALHAQVGYGAMHPMRDALRATELLHRVGRLVESIGHVDWSDEPRCRDVAVRYSDLRDVAELTVWDARLRRWEARPVTEETIWDEVERALQGARSR